MDGLDPEAVLDSRPSGRDLPEASNDRVALRGREASVTRCRRSQVESRERTPEADAAANDDVTGAAPAEPADLTGEVAAGDGGVGQSAVLSLRKNTTLRCDGYFLCNSSMSRKS